MLKKRIIPLLLWLDGKVVKTVGFTSPTVVGKLESLAKLYSDQDADELLILDISSSKPPPQTQIYRELDNLIEHVRCPIGFGGNIETMEDARRLFRLGIEKICIPAYHLSTGLVEQVAEKYGSQAITVSIDLRVEDETIQIVRSRGAYPIGLELDQALQMCLQQGAGEILIQDVKRDGQGKGLNLELLREIRHRIRLPMIGAGGVGNVSHIQDGLEARLDAVACGTLFNFGDNNPLRIKSTLRNNGFAVKASAEIPLR